MQAVQKYVISLFCGFALASCGGGDGGTTTSPLTPVGSGQTNGGTTSSSVISSTQPRVDTVKTAGGATLERTFAPGVISFSDDSQITAENAQTLNLREGSGLLTQGSVFTWKNHAYVASSVTTRTDGTQTISVRDAQFNEVLNNLSVKGDISLMDIDPAKSSFALADDSSQASPKGVVISEKAFTLGPCNGRFGSEEPEQLLTCKQTFKFAQIALNVVAGIRSLKLSGVSLDVKKKEYITNNYSFVPFGSVDASVLGEDGATSKIEGDLAIGRAQLVLQNTFNFIQIQAPLAISYKLPLFRMGLGVEVSLLAQDGNLKLQDYLFKTPISTLGSDKLFAAGIADAFVGLKTGFEVVAVSVPTPVIPPLAFGPRDEADRLGAVGAFVKMGGQGLLSAEVKNINSKPCLRYSLKPAVGISVAAPAAFLNGGITKALNSPILEGQSGCDENPGFWTGTAVIKQCSENGACNFLTYNLNKPEVAVLNFQTAASNLNIRLDQEFGCIGATSGISPSAGSSFSYTLSSAAPFSNQPASTTNFTITNVTETSMSGTLSVSFDKKLYNGLNGTGTASGTWQAVKRGATFPKCLPPTNPADSPAFFCASIVDRGCFFVPQAAPGRTNEWLK